MASIPLGTQPTYFTLNVPFWDIARKAVPAALRRISLAFHATVLGSLIRSPNLKAEYRPIFLTSPFS